MIIVNDKNILKKKILLTFLVYFIYIYFFDHLGHVRYIIRHLFSRLSFYIIITELISFIFYFVLKKNAVILKTSVIYYFIIFIFNKSYRLVILFCFFRYLFCILFFILLFLIFQKYFFECMLLYYLY